MGAWTFESFPSGGFFGFLRLLCALEAEDGDDVAVGGALAGFLEAEAGVALFEVGVAGAPVDADDFAAGDAGEALEDFLHGGAAVAFVLEILVDHEAVDPGAAVLGGV